MSLKNSLRQDIIEFLLDRHNLSSENERKALLYGAGLQQFLTGLNLNGSQREFVQTLVQTCDAYGTTDGTTPAIVALLHYIKTEVGLDRHPNIQNLCQRVMFDFYSAQTGVSQPQTVEDEAADPEDQKWIRSTVPREDFKAIVQKMKRDNPFIASERDKYDLIRIMYYYQYFYYENGHFPKPVLFILRNVRYFKFMVAGTLLAGGLVTLILLSIFGKLAW